MAQSANMDASELARDIAAGLASATTATERAALVPAELVEAIHQLKTQRDAVILAHYYVAPEVQAVADYVGDSFYLAKLAKSLPQQTIVLCGVARAGRGLPHGAHGQARDGRRGARRVWRRPGRGVLRQLHGRDQELE